MTRVVWDDTGHRRYRTGVDRGMLYTTDAAVPWNGLISVAETPSVSGPTAVYLDGQKVLNVPGGEIFEGSVQTYGAPIEFAPCAGRLLLQLGLYGTDQPKETFWFSYRTLTGDDLDGLGSAYRIHIVANAIATSGDFVNSTSNDNAVPAIQSWSVTTSPVIVPGVKPASHFVIDTETATVDVLHEFEAILYGDQYGNVPRIPTPAELSLLLTS